MTPEQPERKRTRFVAEKEDIEITGNRRPDSDQIRDADRVFEKILKKKKPKE